MPGLEVVVRPVVFPNIRPPPSRSLPPEDDPEQGFATIGGGGGSLITLTHSFTASVSKSGGTEISRTFDVARITPSPDAANPDARARSAAGDDDVYIDVEVLTQIKMKDKTATFRYTPIAEADNIKIIRRGVVREK